MYFFFFVLLYYEEIFFFFFFQAEDGIRYYKVTGVQTCALPIWPPPLRGRPGEPTRRGSRLAPWRGTRRPALRRPPRSARSTSPVAEPRKAPAGPRVVVH